ncbi:SusC/RagA family TonB-linked outer membrane protein [Leeuwenhoekiella sp. MAR_2009_132]|uniref:SusC/RagA family TonB-linked outer membrane protein n=1 Tax=Leeuwenhoekiella sp. MAR_2009_132 TaxID=1392489 RepID=UPI000566B891|nr:TonB-dependent receptor [Leeuwenhoekiella sp. MAR_2009_132]
MSKLKLALIALIAMLGQIAFSQTTTITGVVTDENGAPLPGASVVVVGTNNGSQTDFDGNYSITNAPSDGQLVISFVGFFTQTISINNQRTINIQLKEDTAQLDEVVVVGYGTQRKESVTGAVSSISADEVTALPVVSFAEALQGRVPGIQVTNSGGPGTDPIVQIRGVGSITFASTPLYVVDGYPVGGLGDFDNNDIESISVLKDASAAAIYGSRAANGVVLVSTKKGRANGKVEFTYKGFTGFSDVPNTLNLLNREQYLQFGRELLSNAGQAEPARWANLDTPIYAGATQTFAQTDTDYQDALFQSAVTTSHHIDLRGGSDKSRFYGSFGYFKQEGIVVGTGFDRYNFRINSDHEITDWLSIGESLTLANGRRENEGEPGGRTSIQNTIRGVPYIPLRDPTLAGGFRSPDGADGTDPVNPLISSLLNTNEDTNVRILGTAYADLRLVKNLKYRFTFGLDWTSATNSDIQPIYFDGFTGNNENKIRKTTSTFSGNYFSNQLNYENSWGDHNLDVLAVAERQDFQQTTLEGYGERDSNTINVLQGTVNQTTSSTLSESSIFSFLGRVNYDFGGKYLFSASIRRDGSSKFSDDNKWATFPGISAGWNLAQESFMEDVDNITELKLRASWGKMGFEGIGNYESNAGISTDTYAVINGQVVQGAFFQSLANSALEWEITEMTNIGIDLGLYQNRVQFTAEYYKRTTDNLILIVPTADSQGFQGNTLANVGAMENWGLDFSGSYYSKPGTAFQWNASANIGIFRNTVNGLGSGPIFGGRNADFGDTDITRTAVGDPIQSFYGYRVERIFQTQAEIDQLNAASPNGAYQVAQTAPGDIKFKDLNGDGQVTPDDREVIGSFIPDFSYGLNFDANYKNFFMSMYWYGNQGNDVYNALQVTRQGGVRLFGHDVAVLDAWTPENTNTSIPRMISGDPNANNRTSDRYLEDASFLRLQNLKIGYQFPEEWLGRTLNDNVSKLTIYVSGNNLATFTKYSGYDPEIGARGNNLRVQGVDYGQYPRPQSFLLGLELGF